MKNNNFKQSIETLLIAIICSAFVISLNKSCANTMNKFSNVKKENVQMPDSVYQYITSQQMAR